MLNNKMANIRYCLRAYITMMSLYNALSLLPIEEGCIPSKPGLNSICMYSGGRSIHARIGYIFTTPHLIQRVVSGQ